MAEFTNEFDGFEYHAMWGRVSADRINWTATVRRDGEWVGSPKGTFRANHADDVSAAATVRLAVETAIDGGVGVQR
jgi:hypothetical protein